MDRNFIKTQKEKLKKIKERLERELNSLARKSKTVKGDWITKYPEFDGGKLEEETDEVEEYGNILSVSYTLELELKKVNESLEKMKKGKYGICEKCKKPISKGRLDAYPQAKYCIKCQKSHNL